MSKRNKKRQKQVAEPLVWTRKANNGMRKRLVLLLCVVVAALTILCGRITYLNAKDGNRYKKQVLSQSQQKYGSRIIPFQRGDIKDRNGAVLATSEKVYKIILDCSVVNYSKEYREPTVDAMVEILGLDRAEIEERLDSEATKDSPYQVMKTSVPVETKKKFEAYAAYNEIKGKDKLTEQEEMEKARRNNIKGVWFEDEYQRVYPMDSTACHVLGFCDKNGDAEWGLEGYYSNVLNGVNGRQYGYFNQDASVEQDIIYPVNGDSIVTTIDVNIQKIVEKYIQLFMDGMAGEKKEEKGAKNVGVIVMDPDNSQILAMASDTPFDSNNPRDLSADYTQEEIERMETQTDENGTSRLVAELSSRWSNYCVSENFEPGSTVKPLTIAGALSTNSINENDTFECDGYEMFGETRIRCSIYPGEHGTQTLADLLRNSCNDGLMQIGMKMGPEKFIETQNIFNFGMKTGIDLPGEAEGIVHSLEQLSGRGTELASASFGQGFTCTMIQEITAIASVINGGNYYRPYVVSKILDEDGNVKQNIEPALQKQTVSAEISARIREYMGTVCERGGTGFPAKVNGYSMGGKTGTAQKYPREDKKYLVSYIGFAPLDNPQVLIYVVVDEPNAEYQGDSKYAQFIAKGVMKEILPYMNIFMDEELSDYEHEDMLTLDKFIRDNAESFRNRDEEAEDPNLPAPLQAEENLDLNNNLEDEGILNEKTPDEEIPGEENQNIE